jgi:hypothetical protein
MRHAVVTRDPLNMVLVDTATHSNTEMCSNSWETRKLKADASDEFLYCYIRRKKKKNHCKLKWYGLTL